MTRFLQQYDTTIAVTALLAIGFGITWTTIGPGAALRGFAAELAILAAIFYVARQYLPWKDAPKDRIKRARTELIIGLLSYAFWLIGAVVLFRGGRALPWLLAGTLIPAVILFYGRYSKRAWGLKMPTGRELLVLVAVIAITFGLSRVFNIVFPTREVSAAWTALLNFAPRGNLLIVGLVLPAILEEFFFRVYLQPRLAAYSAGRWALFAQAVLYSVAFLPLYLIGNGYPLPYSLALVMVLSNGIMAGYFWRKTGNFPLLILLHLLAFPRFGL